MRALQAIAHGVVWACGIFAALMLWDVVALVATAFPVRAGIAAAVGVVLGTLRYRALRPAIDPELLHKLADAYARHAVARSAVDIAQRRETPPETPPALLVCRCGHTFALHGTGPRDYGRMLCEVCDCETFTQAEVAPPNVDPDAGVAKP